MREKVNGYIDNHSNPAKKNIIDQRREHFVQLLSIPEILVEFQITDDDYYRALSISKDNDFELHLKRKPNSCLVNNYFNDGLKA